MSNETFNVNEAIKAQAKLCKEKNYPHFAPHDGQCWDCGRNIYEKWERNENSSFGGTRKVVSGITVEKAGKELVTGCPHCHRTYCD